MISILYQLFYISNSVPLKISSASEIPSSLRLLPIMLGGTRTSHSPTHSSSPPQRYSRTPPAANPHSITNTVTYMHLYINQSTRRSKGCNVYQPLIQLTQILCQFRHMICTLHKYLQTFIRSHPRLPRARMVPQGGPRAPWRARVPHVVSQGSNGLLPST